jgi:hypothetical protein
MISQTGRDEADHQLEFVDDKFECVIEDEVVEGVPRTEVRQGRQYPKQIFS